MIGIRGQRPLSDAAAHMGASPARMIKVTLRLVNKDLVLPDFPCMQTELASSFIDKMCNQFTMSRDSLRVLSNGKLIRFNQPNLT